MYMPNDTAAHVGYGPAPGPTNVDTPSGADARLAAWASRASEVLAELADFSARAAEATSTATSSGGEVEVTVGASGELVAARFAPEVMRWHPDDLAAEVLRVSDQARAGLDPALDDAIGGVAASGATGSSRPGSWGAGHGW